MTRHDNFLFWGGKYSDELLGSSSRRGVHFGGQILPSSARSRTRSNGSSEDEADTPEFQYSVQACRANRSM